MRKVRKRWFYWHIRNPYVYWCMKLPKRIRMIKKPEFWANRLHELHFSQIVFGKFTFMLSVINFIVLISLKWDFDPMEYMIVIAPTTIFIMWFVGWILERWGVRQAFREAEFKNVRIK